MADQKILLNYCTVFIKSLKWFVCEKTARPIFMQLVAVYHAKKQHFEKNSRIGPCNPPSGSLCLTFREMTESSHEQSARVMILNSNRPKPKQIAA
jgi:hypothetical protein